MDTCNTNNDDDVPSMTNVDDSLSEYDNDTTSTEDELQSTTRSNDNSTSTIYIPDFLEEYDTVERKTKENADKITNFDWVPLPLKKEVSSHCYRRNTENPTTNNARDQEDFLDACNKLFPQKRIFASHRQLDQVADMFLSSWGVKKKHSGQQIRCFYSPDHNKKNRRVQDETKRRSVTPSPKEVVSCPFFINYSILGSCKGVPKLFHRVRISRTCFEHTCNPSTISHRVAIERSGKSMPNLTGLQGVITLLRNKPTLSSSNLRPLLKAHIPWFKPTDSKFVGNFKRKVLKFILENPSDASLTHADLLDLTSKNSAANEPTVQDSPLSRANLREVLSTVMQEGPDIWDALALLNKYKQMNPGLDYRVRYHPVSSKPEAVCWVLPEMKQDAIRYGNLLFLDAQKRDMNSPGWPYIAPCVKDNENKVRVIAECLCISESIENYVWVLKSIVDMEKRFRLSNVDIIFADQFITETLLVELGIKNTCTLHSDYYHNLNKVFPETFGNKFEQIRKYLKVMLTGEENAWHNGYKQAREHLIGDPQKLSSLEQIYRRPGYFSCWKIRTVEGNLFCKGSVPAEQNHASVVAHLGRGGNLSISEHITALTQRQCHLNQLRQKQENQRRLFRAKSSSTRAGQTGINDVCARKCLSSYAWNLYYKETQTELQYIENDDGTIELWLPTSPKEQRKDCNHYFVWNINEEERCPCFRRTCLGIQCRHELTRYGKFMKDKWSMRWYNDETYRVYFIEHENAFPPAESNRFVPNNEDNVDDVSYSQDLDGDNERFINSSVNEYPKPASREGPTYQSLLEKMSELARLVHRDSSISTSLQFTINAMLERVREGKGIDVYFVESTSIEIQDATQPLIGRLGTIPNATNMKRLRSRHEICASYRRNGKRNRLTNDTEYARNNVKTKTCSFCRGSGHTKNHCPKIEEYDCVPIKSTADRDTLISNLERPSYYVTNECLADDKRPIADSLPAGSRGIVIHNKNKNVDGRIFFEVTVLVEGGNKHTTYQNYPFSKGALGRFINKSNALVVLCQLKVMEDINYNHFDEQGVNLLSQTSLLGGFTQSYFDGAYSPVARMSTDNSNNGGVAFSQSSANESYLDKIGFGNGVGDL